MSKSSRKIRLDQLLVQRGLVESRSRVQALILAGKVMVEETRIDKAGTQVAEDANIRLKQPDHPYVSRGGVKLQGAISALGLDARQKVVLDVGASTGGFTDCLLQRGALTVYAFDVGRGQLNWTLQQNTRVIVRDRFNVRSISETDIGQKVDLFTADLSFISLRLVLPSLKKFEDVLHMLLVKPQFEAEPGEVETGGLITSREKREEIVTRVRKAATDLGFMDRGIMSSPIRGQKGNQEFFLYLSS